MESTPTYSQPLAAIDPQSIQWLWPSYLPLSKVSLLTGPAGSGKSLLALHIAAALSRGSSPGPVPALAPNILPMEPLAGPVSTLILAPADDPADTLRPRLQALNADPDRIYILPRQTLAAKSDQLMANLTLAARQRPDARLLILDPISEFFAFSGYNHRFLFALARFAADFHLAVLTLLTPASNAWFRRLLAETARAHLQIAPDVEVPGQSLLNVIKINAAQLPPPLPFHITSAGLAFDRLPAPPVSLAAEDETSILDLAIDFLKETLADGPIPQRELVHLAEETGLAPISLRRAKTSIRVKSFKYKMNSSWYWRLPGDTRTPEDRP